MAAQLLLATELQLGLAASRPVEEEGPLLVPILSKPHGLALHSNANLDPQRLGFGRGSPRLIRIALEPLQQLSWVSYSSPIVPHFGVAERFLL